VAGFASECSHSPARSPRIRARPSKPPRRQGREAVRLCVLRRFDRELGVNGYPQILADIPRLPSRDPDVDLAPERSNVFEDQPLVARPQVPLQPPHPSQSFQGPREEPQPNDNQANGGSHHPRQASGR
jgi:hypothetical protein